MDNVDTRSAAISSAQDRALDALATLLEDLGDQAGAAFLRDRPEDQQVFADCQDRALAVARAIMGLRSITLIGASAKARAARASVTLALLPRDVVDALAVDMHADVVRLRGGEVVGHA